jgi:hypothetical protein
MRSLSSNPVLHSGCSTILPELQQKLEYQYFAGSPADSAFQVRA